MTWENYNQKWDNVPPILKCDVCLDLAPDAYVDPKVRSDCWLCRGTKRHPIPFEEVWGL